ncbi:MAG: hypothetical protein FRX48_01005 [Lasallia pustulata]|uniref:Uncharacterized protein n=1 Tax=Lasallia pustulata TaxID=136370 RepID=A0A5M8Q501_9LECA|nr:MAG: hypothetical protein FRX48_01005 [Lasallia pustulata]
MMVLVSSPTVPISYVTRRDLFSLVELFEIRKEYANLPRAPAVFSTATDDLTCNPRSPTLKATAGHAELRGVRAWSVFRGVKGTNGQSCSQLFPNSHSAGDGLSFAGLGPPNNVQGTVAQPDFLHGES